MTPVSHKHGRGLLALMAALALAAGACSGSSATAAPAAGTNAPGVTTAPGATVDPGAGEGGLDDAAAKLSGITSYQFKMTMQGGSHASMLSAFGGTGAAGGAFVVTGTVVTSPEKASDISFGTMKIISIGGFDYMDLGTGTFMKTKATSSSMADAFSPTSLFGSSVGSSSSGYSKVGTESKNGVNADHYTANSVVLAQYAKSLDKTAASWTADVWVSAEGGYPVSTAIVGSDAGGKVVYQLVFDITNVNDPANKVTAPANAG